MGDPPAILQGFNAEDLMSRSFADFAIRFPLNESCEPELRVPGSDLLAPYIKGNPHDQHGCIDACKDPKAGAVACRIDPRVGIEGK